MTMNRTAPYAISPAPRRMPRFVAPAALLIGNAALGTAIALLIGESLAQIAANALLCAGCITVALTCVALALAALSALRRFDIGAIIKAHGEAMLASLRRSLPDEAALLAQRLNEEIEEDDESEDETEPRVAVSKESEGGQNQ